MSEVQHAPPPSASPLRTAVTSSLHLTPKRRKLVPLRDHLTILHRVMPGSGSPPRVADTAPGHPACPSGSTTMLASVAQQSCPRRARFLDNIDPSYTAMSGLCAASDVGTPRGGSIRIQHVTAAAAAAASSSAPSTHAVAGTSGLAAPGDDAPARFPRLDECAHFHYDHVELGPLQVRVYEEELKPLGVEESEDESPWCVQVTSLGRAWLLRRNYRDFCTLDRQLHRCIYDRKFSALPDLPDTPPSPTDDNTSLEECTRRLLSSYLSRFSQLAGSLINCGPVLNWLELDNRGHRLIVTEDNAINTPAVAAAYAVRRYVAQAADEISFEVGDMISVIDMPPPEESIWWRGKRGFEVGFFPCDTVAVIGDKVPKNLHLTAGPPPSMTSNPVSAPPVVSAPLAAAAVTSAMALPSKPVLRKHGKLIAFFRSFILNRPSRRRLKHLGILKERVFGCDLGEHLLNSGHDIPMVLKCCAEFIESSGIVDGIYRLSGVTSNIQKLRNAFDEDRIPALYEDESIIQDIHSVASLLKMYFRELPNPLCTYQLYQQFVAAVQAQEKERLYKMREAVQKLPPPHYRTLEYLIGHLARVASRGHETGMTPRNVAIVWAPNLLRCKELEVGGVAALQGVGVQAVVTEYLVCCADLIFCDKLPAAPDTPPISEQGELMVSTLRRTNRPKSLAISTPTKLLSLEEARTRALGQAGQEFIEVGGGPSKLPEKYHTVIELPAGARKRGSSLKAKRSPLGWRSLFGGSKTRASSARPSTKQGRKSATPTDLEQSGLESEVLQPKRPLRPVKSAESLGSGGGSAHNSARNSAALDLEPPSCGSPESPSVAGPLPTSIMLHTSFLSAKPSHNRSVSHDSYFDHLAGEEEEGDGSLDLSEIQLNFELEDNEMRIFSEDETLVSTSAGSPSSTMSQAIRARAHPSPRTCPLRARAEELSMSSADPSPKKNKKCSTSPSSRKRSKLEAARTITPHSVKVEELRYIDSQSPEPNITLAEVHHERPPSDASISNACATVSLNEIMTLHSSESSGLTTPSSPPCYAPLVSDNEQPSSSTTPADTAMSLEGLYENIASGNWDQIQPNTKLLYQNVMPVTTNTDDNVYEDVEVGNPPAPVAVDPEEVYQQVRAFRRSVAEVNELMSTPPSSPAAPSEERKSWSPLQLAADSEDLRRRFDCEIGRDIVRERRMRTELEKMRADSSPSSLLAAPSTTSLEKVTPEPRLTISPPSSLTCLSIASGDLSPQTTAAPLLPETEGSLTSLSSATSSGFNPLSLSPSSPTSPLKSGGKTPDTPPSPSKPQDVMIEKIDTAMFDISNMSTSQISSIDSECSEPNVDSISPTTQNSEVNLISPVISPIKEGMKFLLSPILSSDDVSESPEISSQRIQHPISLNLSKTSQLLDIESPSLDDNTSLDLSRLQESPSLRDTPTSFLSSPDIPLSPLSASQILDVSPRPAPPSYPTTPTTPLISPSKSSPDPKSTSTKSSPISPDPWPVEKTKSPNHHQENLLLSSPKSENMPDIWEENSSETLSIKSDTKSINNSDFKLDSDDVELRNSNTENLRPKSAPSTGKTGTIKVHLTLTSRRSSEPVKSLSLADTRRLENRKASVKELLNRFEGSSGVHKSMPPCLRAKAAKGQLASNMSASLDEDRFNEHARELVRVQTSPDVTSQDENKNPTPTEETDSKNSTEVPTKIDLARNLLTSVNLDDPERRERIERYKEERRNFLREKYRSESFRGERDDIVTRLKQKTSKIQQPIEDEYSISRSVSANESLGSVEGIRSRSQSESSSTRNRQPTSPTYSLKDNLGALFESASENTKPPGSPQYFSSV